MTKPFQRAGLDLLDSSFKPSATLLKQLEQNAPFIEHMLAKPEGEAEESTNEETENND